MGSYGGEFVNLFEVLRSSTPVQGTELTGLTASRFRSLWLSPIQTSSVVMLYFSRRDFFLDGSEGPIIVPRSVTLSFGPAGVLRLSADTTLIIEGEIKALPFRIFTLDGEGASRAVVRIESELMEEVRPEWWGARPLRNQSERSSGDGFDSEQALQDCLRTACAERRRDGRPLTPLTVRCETYASGGRLTVDATAPATLWMEGKSDPVGADGVTPTLVRHPTRVSSSDVREAALVLGSRVSAELRNVGVHVQPAGGGAPGPADVAGGLLVRTSAATPPHRHVYLDRCGFAGGRDYLVRIEETEAPEPAGAPMLPTASATLPPVAPSQVTPGRTDTKASVVPSRFALASPPARRYVATDSYFTGQFAGRGSTRVMVDARLVPASTLEMTTCFVRESLPGLGFRAVVFEAAIVLRGGSALLRGTTFHTVSGPRPSRPFDGTRPDGHDVWLDASEATPPTHLTMLHVESQSWWLLGAATNRTLSRDGNVVLLNVGARNVNWGEVDKYGLASIVADDIVRVRNAGRRSATTLGDGENVHPPSVSWGYLRTRLVLVGCRFLRYVTAPVNTAIWDVGTTFAMPGSSRSHLRWTTPEYIPAPPTWLVAMPLIPLDGVWNGIVNAPHVYSLNLVDRGV